MRIAWVVAVALAAFTWNGRARADDPYEAPEEERAVFELRSSRANAVVAPHATLQVRGMLPFDDAQHAFTQGDITNARAFMLRRVRAAVDAGFFEDLAPSDAWAQRTARGPRIRVHVSTDLVDEVTPAATRTPLVLGYADLELARDEAFGARGLWLAAGLMRVPFTRHGLVDETRQIFLEAPTAWRADRLGIGRGPVPALLPDRRVGVELHKDGPVAAAIGAFTGGGEGSVEPSASGLVASRVELSPWGPVALEGPHFFDDESLYASPHLAVSAGALLRFAPDHTRTVGGSLGAAASYRCLYASVEGAVGVGRTPTVSPDAQQTALSIELVCRVHPGVRGSGVSLELGARYDTWRIDRAFALGGDQKSASTVFNLYVWRHRVKASTLLRSVRTDDAVGRGDRQEGVLELTVGF